MRIRMHYCGHGKITKINDKQMLLGFEAFHAYVAGEPLTNAMIHRLERDGVNVNANM